MLTIVILLALIVGLIIGYQKGMVRQLGSLAAIIVAVLACHIFGEEATKVAYKVMDIDEASSIGAQAIASVTGNIALFVVVWCVVGLLSRMLSGIVNAIHLGAINSLLGAIMMSLKVWLVASILLNVWTIVVPERTEEITNGNIVVSSTHRFGPALMGIAKSGTFNIETIIGNE